MYTTECTVDTCKPNYTDSASIAGIGRQISRGNRFPSIWTAVKSLEFICLFWYVLFFIPQCNQTYYIRWFSHRWYDRSAIRNVDWFTISLISKSLIIRQAGISLWYFYPLICHLLDIKEYTTLSSKFLQLISMYITAVRILPSVTRQAIFISKYTSTI